MEKQPILVSAFACLPDGSAEDCVGWNWILELAHHYEVWALVNANNQQQIIESHLERSPLANVHWIFHDVPRWLQPLCRFEKTGYIRYTVWQLGAYKLAAELHSRKKFAVVHHVTYVQYWSGSCMSLLPTVFLWGPLGGGEVAPKAFYISFGGFGLFYELLRDLARNLAQLNPLVRHNARHAELLLATTDETARRLRALGAKHVCVMPTIRLSQLELHQLEQIPVRTGSNFRVLSAGRILHWKGFYLAVRAFAQLLKEHPKSEYWIAGEGPDTARIWKIAKRLGIGERIRWWGRVSRHEVYDLLSQCDVLLHPSLHDSGGYICLEAMAAGRPVVCFDLGGTRSTGHPRNGYQGSCDSSSTGRT